MKIINTLKWIGIIFIAAGIIYGLTQIGKLGELKEDVDYWKDAAEENYDNPYIEDSYLT